MGFLLFDLIFGKEEDETKCTQCNGTGVYSVRGASGECLGCGGSGLREDQERIEFWDKNSMGFYD